MSPEQSPGRRTELDIMKAQVQAIDAWSRAHELREAAASAASLTREMRLDMSRRMEGRRRQQAAIVTRTDAQLRRSGDVLHVATPPRAVIAHRNEWMTQKLQELLSAREVRVVGAFDDGADAAGTIVAEQPDLVIVEDRLSTLTGVDVVREAREYSPYSLIGAQALDRDGVSALVDAGAHAVFTRRVPPADVVDQLLACMEGDVRPRRALTVL
jgi:CheY-like chemotaxis protein